MAATELHEIVRDADGEIVGLRRPAERGAVLDVNRLIADTQAAKDQAYQDGAREARRILMRQLDTSEPERAQSYQRAAERAAQEAVDQAIKSLERSYQDAAQEAVDQAVDQAAEAWHEAGYRAGVEAGVIACVKALDPDGTCRELTIDFDR